MNEAETRAELIEHALKTTGCGVVEGSRVRREVIRQGRLAELSEFKQSILHKAFSGELTKNPDKVLVDPWEFGSCNTYEMLYAIFERDIKQAKTKYCGHQVWYFSRPEDFEEGKEKIFWHLTSREEKPKPVPRRKRKFAAEMQADQNAERLPDLRRSERLPWVRPIIEQAAQPEVIAWDYEEGDGDIHTYAWLKQYDFVVIMKKYHDGRRRLITSFYIDYAKKRHEFERKYSNRMG